MHEERVAQEGAPVRRERQVHDPARAPQAPHQLRQVAQSEGDVLDVPALQCRERAPIGRVDMLDREVLAQQFVFERELHRDGHAVDRWWHRPHHDQPGLMSL
jgi:hypothetical protein